MLTLSIETSSKNCSVATHFNGNLISDTNIFLKNSHSKYLLSIIDDILKSSIYNKFDLKAISVSIGPGSYTGLRIGISTAKALCYGLNIPIITFDSLSIMNYQIDDYKFFKDFLLCPTIYMGRMEFFCFIEGYLKIQNKILNSNSFSDILSKHKILFFGSDTSKIREVIKNPNAFFIDNINIKACNMGKETFKKLINKDFDNLELIEPYYGKLPGEKK